MPPEITRIELTAFTYPIADVRRDHATQKLVYAPGKTCERQRYTIRIHTNTEFTGEYIGGGKLAAVQVGLCAEYLIGSNPLRREKHWNAMREMLRKYDQMGLGLIDIALWDFAGKYADLPIHELLGTHRTRLPAYASTYFAQPDSGLSSPDDFADFAETCHDYGYRGFKTHTWCESSAYDLKSEIELIETVGERVGDRMALMHDPVGKYETRSDALRVGKVCDEYGYFWYEDPYMDMGQSQHSHRNLRESIDTPVLQTELVRGVEPTVDFIASDATDFARADPEWDGGITGAMKIARAAEGLGVDIEYHLAGPAQRHCMAATRNSNFYELGLVHPNSKRPHSEYPVYKDGYTDRINSIDEDGTVGIPNDPGLGVEYDWDYVSENTADRTVYE